MRRGSLQALLVFLLGFCLGISGNARAQLSVEPILRIETGGHQSLITRVSTDAQGRWIVTASEDKTARLWDTGSGKLLSVLRPPVGAEGLGAIYAAPLSPDGKQIALGGKSAFDGRTHSLVCAKEENEKLKNNMMKIDFKHYFLMMKRK